MGLHRRELSRCLEIIITYCVTFNTLRPRQNGRHFTDDTFKPTFLNENIRISIKISLKFLPKVPINNIPALVQIMAWRRPGDKPLSEPMLVNLPTHTCVTRPQWVNSYCHFFLSLSVIQPIIDFAECNAEFSSVMRESQKWNGQALALKRQLDFFCGKYIHSKTA